MTKQTEAPSTPIPGSIDPEKALRDIENADAVTATATEVSPLASEEYVFTIDHTDGAGVRRKGEFKNRILTIEQRLNLSILMARLSRNTPWEAMDPEGQYLLTIIAHLTSSLAEKPAWFKPSELKVVALMHLVYGEVAKHEAYFRGDRPAEGAGA